MGRVGRTRALAGAVMPVLLAVTLVGCAPTTGAVEVRVAANAPAAGYSVQVTDAHGRTVGRAHLEPGQSRGFDRIPLGAVAVTAVGLCTVSGALAAGGTVRAIFGDQHCTLG